MKIELQCFLNEQLQVNLVCIAHLARPRSLMCSILVILIDCVHYSLQVIGSEVGRSEQQELMQLPVVFYEKYACPADSGGGGKE